MLGFTFPGQGSQSVGMLSELADHSPCVRRTFAEASEVLGYDLWALCQEGPVERLNSTLHTQPAMLTAGVSTWRAWKDAGGPAASLLAGHSLGEFSALVCAEAIEFSDAVKVVAARAKFMQEAVPVGEGGIAAILGLDEATVVEVCKEISNSAGQREVSAVNFNAPGQVVIAGHADAVAKALGLAKERGARKAIPLPMSVPVHCRLMKPAADRFESALAKCPISTPSVPVVHNARIAPADDVDDLRRSLVDQLTRPVPWIRTIQYYVSSGITRVVELGPGKVLTSLNRRIDKSLRCSFVQNRETLEAAIALAHDDTPREV